MLHILISLLEDACAPCARHLVMGRRIAASPARYGATHPILLQPTAGRIAVCAGHPIDRRKRQAGFAAARARPASDGTNSDRPPRLTLRKCLYRESCYRTILRVHIALNR